MIDTKGIPPEALVLGTPDAVYRSTNNQFQNGGCLLAIGAPFVLYGVLELVRGGTGKPSIPVLIAAAAVMFAGMLNLLGVFAKQGTAPFRRSSPYSPEKQRVSIGLAVVFCAVLFGSVGIGINAGLAALGVLLVALGIWGLIRALTEKPIIALTFRDGFSYVMPKRVEIFRWDEIGALWLYAVMGQLFLTVERAHDKTHIMLDSFLDNVDDLAIRIQDETIAHMLPKMTRDFEAGQQLQFGKLIIDQLGIHSDQHSREWAKISSVTFLGDGIEVEHQGQREKWSEIVPTETPNPPIVMEFIKRKLGGTLLKAD